MGVPLVPGAGAVTTGVLNQGGSEAIVRAGLGAVIGAPAFFGALDTLHTGGSAVPRIFVEPGRTFTIQRAEVNQSVLFGLVVRDVRAARNDVG